MIFTRPMIDLAKEVRRRAPSELKPSIKMANPDVFDILIELYRDSKDTIFKTLIKELITQAGEPWKSALLRNDAPKKSDNRQLARPNTEDQHTEWFDRHDSDRSKRIYRGHVVNG